MTSNGQHDPDDVFHIEGDDGLTMCGLSAKHVMLGGPFITPLCQRCEEALIAEHPYYDKD